jgi:outer membrane immunogenic protein
MKKILLGAIAAVVLSGTAFAADLPARTYTKAPPPVAPVWTDPWSGFYVGLNAGGAVGNSSAVGIIGCPPIVGYLCNPTVALANGALVGATASGSKSGSGFTGGVLAGYNWHRGLFVYGVESDFGSMHFALTNGGSAPSINPGLLGSTFTDGTTIHSDWLATLRGRIGYLASPNLLVYGTGGLALTNLSVSNFYTDNFGGALALGGAIENSTVSKVKTGYAVGAGAEWALGPRWKIRAEYLYVDFGSLTTLGNVTIAGIAVNPFQSSADLKVNLIRGGVTYSF